MGSGSKSAARICDWGTAVWATLRRAAGSISTRARGGKSPLGPKTAPGPAASSPDPHLQQARAGVRRMRGLGRISERVYASEHLDAVFRDVAAMLPFCWYHTEVATARITWDSRVYESESFEPGEASLTSPLTVNGRRTGEVTVYYTQSRPVRDQGPFLREEQDLLDTVSRLLSLAVERAKARDMLCDAEQKFLALFNNSVNGVLLVERHTRRLCLANPVWCGMFGYANEEIDRLTWADIQSGSRPGPGIDQETDSLTGQHCLHQDVPARRKDGSMFSADISSFPIMVGDKDYLLSLFRDVTERTLSQIRQARWMEQLSQTNRDLGDFVVTLDRDVKALLRGLQMWTSDEADLRIDEEDRARQREAMARKERRVQGLLDAVGKYFRVGLGEARERVVDLGPAIRDVVASLQVPESISVTFEGVFPVVKVQGGLWADVLSHLVRNAIEYMDKPQGRVRIRCVDDGDHWRIRVEDNGPGIDPRHLDRAFQLFERLGTDTRPDALGVGLALAKKCVESWGGRIGVESCVGQGSGSVFWFTLPKSTTGSGMRMGRILAKDVQDL